LKTPVIFLVFNRPDHTRQVLASIREARPERLYVVADGPRPEVSVDAARCRDTRAVIESGIDWPCEVTRDYVDMNLGCARRVSSGITRAFQSMEEAIILEDDCLPDASFFPYAEAMLERYRDDAGVMSISGSRLRPWTAKEPAGSTSFSNYFHCWGWATWARAWHHYDHDLSQWRERLSPEAIRELLGSDQQMRYWTKCLDLARDGRLRTWAFRYMFSCWEHGGKSVIPRVNLVRNTGFGELSTNTSKAQKNPCEAAGELREFAPGAPEMNPVYDRKLHAVHREPGLVEKVRRRLERALCPR